MNQPVIKTQIKLDTSTMLDVINIGIGVYEPLKGFLNSQELNSVVETMRLTTNVIWPIPIILGVDEDIAQNIRLGETVSLVNDQDQEIATMIIEEKFSYDFNKLVRLVYGTNDINHPGVARTMKMPHYLLAGPIKLTHFTRQPFPQYYRTPEETRQLFAQRQWKTIVGFQTRNVPHVGHEHLQRTALEGVDGLFINPVIGPKKAGDFHDEVIIKSYETLIDKYLPTERVILGILPMKMSYAGPREAVLHALIRKNFGCTHFVIGRDHAGVGNYYGPLDAQKIFDTLPDLGIKILKFEHARFCKKCNQPTTTKTCSHTDEDLVKPSGTFIRECIEKDQDIPSEIMRPEVIETINSFKEPLIK